MVQPKTLKLYAERFNEFVLYQVRQKFDVTTGKMLDLALCGYIEEPWREICQKVMLIMYICWYKTLHADRIGDFGRIREAHEELGQTRTTSQGHAINP